MKKQRIQKLISQSGYCSRRKAEKLIAKGLVTVNDKVANFGDKALESDIINIQGKQINIAKINKVYIAFNKPLDCVTAVSDDKYKTVLDYIKTKEKVFPVGRLDLKTTGLLLLTNDGDWANKITHPSQEITKTYEVKLDISISDEHISDIEKGILLKEGRTSKAKIDKINSRHLYITVHQGWNRIIRRIFAKLGYTVRGLTRVKIGCLGLDNLALKQGKWRKISDKERNRVLCQ